MKLTRRAALVAAATAAFGLNAHAAGADLKVGVNVALSGPNSSLGIPYSKGMQAALAYKGEVAGHKVQLILLDDASDPADRRPQRQEADRGRQGRRADGLLRRAVVDGDRRRSRKETKTPMIGLSPIVDRRRTTTIGSSTVAQPTQLMVDAVVERMKAQRRQDRRLHRLFRRLGRPRLRRADEGGAGAPASRS